jgi:uncharacterized membrane protein
MIELSVIIGSIGVGLLLIAFFLNLFKFIERDSYSYVLMNIFGAGLACYTSILINYIPFVILEGTWSLVAVVGFIKLLK